MMPACPPIQAWDFVQFTIYVNSNISAEMPINPYFLRMLQFLDENVLFWGEVWGLGAYLWRHVIQNISVVNETSWNRFMSCRCRERVLVHKFGLNESRFCVLSCDTEIELVVSYETYCCRKSRSWIKKIMHCLN